jgi:hypothetical protein
VEINHTSVCVNASQCALAFTAKSTHFEKEGSHALFCKTPCGRGSVGLTLFSGNAALLVERSRSPPALVIWLAAKSARAALCVIIFAHVARPSPPFRTQKCRHRLCSAVILLALLRGLPFYRGHHLSARRNSQPPVDSPTRLNSRLLAPSFTCR